MRPMSEELCRGKLSIMVFCGSPLSTCFFCCHSPKRRMEDFPRQNSSLIGLKTQAKFENDCITRSGYRFKITQPNLMMLVSFSSAEDALSNNVNKYNTFSSQGTENPPFRFLWDTRYNHSSVKVVNINPLYIYYFRLQKMSPHLSQLTVAMAHRNYFRQNNLRILKLATYTKIEDHYSRCKSATF